MNVMIEDGCISCGLCVEICPEVFEMGEDIAVVKISPVPEQFVKDTIDAAEQCPVEVIKTS